jgi:hypothetical protein
MSAGAARLNGDGTITAIGAGAQYRAAGALAKAHRLRRQGERLHARHEHYERLAAGDSQHPLHAKRYILAEEQRRVSRRRSHLNDALAWSAARWAVDQAIAAGATVVYAEDLRSLEARGMGRTLNTAAPRSRPPGPGRAHDRHNPRPAPAQGTRGGTRRRLPPERPRHPTPMGRRSQDHKGH